MARRGAFATRTCDCAAVVAGEGVVTDLLLRLGATILQRSATVFCLR
jgi:hypothetical protein